MTSRFKDRRDGFTIIEVLIVLAIAGLILLVVFLAVPAVQRNQRNNSKHDEAKRILGAYAEVSTNKGRAGQVLDTGVSDGTATTDADAKAVFDIAKLNEVTVIYIRPHAANNLYARSTTASPQQVVTPNSAIIRKGAKCADPLFTVGQTDQRSLGTAGSAKQIALYYAVESRGGINGLVLKCINT